jgi:hypothetical protein
MNGKDILDNLLDIIGKDDELVETFAKCLGISEIEFGDFIDNAKLPEFEYTPDSK